MKKVILMVLVVGLFAGAGVVRAVAQEKTFGFSLNLGLQTPGGSEGDGNGPWFTLDARLHFRLGKSFEIGPECMVAFSSHGQYFYPGPVLNFMGRHLFVGAGVVFPMWTGKGAPLWTDEGPGDARIAPRVNVGYRAGKLLVTFYFIAFTEWATNFLEMNCLGGTVGYRF